MTILAPQDPDIMALDTTTGAGPRLRPSRAIGLSMLGLGLIALAPPAYADQNLLVADNGTVRCDASLKDLTRITLADDQFASVSKVQTGNSAEDFEVVNEPVRGDIYLSVGQGFVKSTISFFATTHKGFVYKFLCNVAGNDAKQVFIANADVAAPRPVGIPIPSHLSPQEEAARLIAALYATQSVEGYDTDWRPLAPVAAPLGGGTITVQRIGEYRGHTLAAKLIKLTNSGKTAVTMREGDLAPADAVAISLAREKLEPGEATTAFIVVSTKTQGDRP